MREGGRPTLSDVARAAGVGTATAGRALGGYGYVSDAVRERVRAAAEGLGYRSNHLARSMITGRTQTIGVVGGDISNPFFAGAVRGIADVARTAGFGTILTNSDEDLEIEREAVRVLLGKQVDGIVVAPSNLREVAHLTDAIAAGTPVVLLDRTSSLIDADSVVIDNVAAAQEAVQHLLKLGHRHIAVVTELSRPGEAEWARRYRPGTRPRRDMLYPSSLRLLGYLRAHEAAGVAVSAELVRSTGRYSADTAREEMLAALDSNPRPSAVFATDSLMSLGAYQAVRDAGRSIPDELSFVAFDDAEWTRLVTPTITVVSQAMYDMGAAAARRLMQRISGLDEPARQIVLPSRLIERESTGRPPDPRERRTAGASRRVASHIATADRSPSHRTGAARRD